MADFALASLIILGVLAGWIAVDRIYQNFAARHPERGPFRSTGGDCGNGCCSCHNSGCEIPSVDHDSSGAPDRHHARS